MPINELYPDHAEALKAADLVDDKFPKFGEVWADLADNIVTEKKRQNGRTIKVYFCDRIQ
eukprot:9215593-Ditylum_brightwellii.AAC.1